MVTAVVPAWSVAVLLGLDSLPPQLSRAKEQSVTKKVLRVGLIMTSCGWVSLPIKRIFARKCSEIFRYVVGFVVWYVVKLG
jgi:hypothetical protein